MAYSSPRHSNPNPASTSLFRRLVWEGTVPLEIHVDPKELPANSDRGLDSYFIQAPRISYLPLLIPDVRKNLVDLILDETAIASIKEDDWWFEEAVTGTVMKWHWPIGLLFDHHTISISTQSSQSGFASTPGAPAPLRLTLHFVSPPTDKLIIQPSAETCKQAFMGQVKEADFLRWGNTKRVTGLRKQEQDGLWDGVKDHNFDDFWRVASKIFPVPTAFVPTLHDAPLPSPSPSHVSNFTSTQSQIQAQTRPASTDPATGQHQDRDGAYNVRSIPVRVYLPSGGPVLQDLVPPIAEEGRESKPNTLRKFLHSHLPLLFPLLPTPPLAYALVQGVLAPPESEIAWLGACLAGADGWVNICVGVGRPRI